MNKILIRRIILLILYFLLFINSLGDYYDYRNYADVRNYIQFTIYLISLFFIGFVTIFRKRYQGLQAYFFTLFLIFITTIYIIRDQLGLIPRMILIVFIILIYLIEIFGKHDEEVIDENIFIKILTSNSLLIFLLLFVIYFLDGSEFKNYLKVQSIKKIDIYDCISSYKIVGPLGYTNLKLETSNDELLNYACGSPIVLVNGEPLEKWQSPYTINYLNPRDEVIVKMSTNQEIIEHFGWTINENIMRIIIDDRPKGLSSFEEIENQFDVIIDEINEENIEQVHSFLNNNSLQYKKDYGDKNMIDAVFYHKHEKDEDVYLSLFYKMEDRILEITILNPYISNEGKIEYTNSFVSNYGVNKMVESVLEENNAKGIDSYRNESYENSILDEERH